MAYKDILVFLDPTAELIERLKFAVGLAKANGARLVGVDVSAPSGVLAADDGAVTQKAFEDATRQAGVKAAFTPTDKPGEGAALTHCVDLLVAPAPGGASREVVRHGALDRALLDTGAPMLILPPDWTGGKVGEMSSSPGTAGARRCARRMTPCPSSRRRAR